MRVNVTQKDIDEGVRRSSCECPIALALKRVTQAPYITVGHSYARWGAAMRDPGVKYGWFPSTASQFVADFDNDGVGKPFSFELEEAHYYGHGRER